MLRVALTDPANGTSVALTGSRSLLVQPFDLLLDAARGVIPGLSTENKFGRSTNVDNGVDTDIWDRANATDDQDLWVAPTASRIHQITSSSASDAEGGVGARTVRVIGLHDWDSPRESSELIVMNGVSNVPTRDHFVIIHRMQVESKGGTSSNVGNITATADVDGTVTAQINAGAGQTLMAIYGVSSNQTAFMGRLYSNVNKSGGAAAAVDVALLYNPEPQRELTNFQIRHTFGLNTTGTSALTIDYYTPKVFVGPGILKVQANGSANDLDVSGGFDLVLVDKE